MKIGGKGEGEKEEKGKEDIELGRGVKRGEGKQIRK